MPIQKNQHLKKYAYNKKNGYYPERSPAQKSFGTDEKNSNASVSRTEALHE
jgi:hypothetical protein